ncbi:hypothetical protein GW17_00033387, partial [Ensete ventricosum]
TLSPFCPLPTVVAVVAPTQAAVLHAVVGCLCSRAGIVAPPGGRALLPFGGKHPTERMGTMPVGVALTSNSHARRWLPLAVWPRAATLCGMTAGGYPC